MIIITIKGAANPSLNVFTNDVGTREIARYPCTEGDRAHMHPLERNMASHAPDSPDKVSLSFHNNLLLSMV